MSTETWVIVNRYAERCWRSPLFGPQEFHTREAAELEVDKELRIEDMDPDECAVMTKAQAVIEYGEEVLR